MELTAESAEIAEGGGWVEERTGDGTNRGDAEVAEEARRRGGEEERRRGGEEVVGDWWVIGG